jgi:hypothetical protein
MKRNLKKLTLNRETLKRLDAVQLQQAAGGYPISGMTNCTDCFTYNTQCVSDNCTFTCHC